MASGRFDLADIFWPWGNILLIRRAEVVHQKAPDVCLRALKVELMNKKAQGAFPNDGIHGDDHPHM